MATHGVAPCARRTGQTDQIDQTDYDLDHLDPSLPLWDAVQDPYSTDPINETCAIS